MRKRWLTIPLLAFLISQGLLLEHLYHEHSPDEICEVCLYAPGHDHAIIPTLPEIFSNSLFRTTGVTLASTEVAAQFNYQQIRAPPSLF
ncbi:MAG: hypothetical protein ABW104_01070 [Candidatus Thiodiazotropha sp. 6PLUC2]